MTNGTKTMLSTKMEILWEKKLFSDRKMKCLGLVTLISQGKAV